MSDEIQSLSKQEIKKVDGAEDVETDPPVDQEFEILRDKWKKIKKQVSSIDSTISKQKKGIIGIKRFQQLSEDLIKFYSDVDSQYISPFTSSINSMDESIKAYFKNQKSLTAKIDQFMKQFDNMKDQIDKRRDAESKLEKSRKRLREVPTSQRANSEKEKKYDECKQTFNTVNNEVKSELKEFIEKRFVLFDEILKQIISNQMELFNSINEGYKTSLPTSSPPTSNFDFQSVKDNKITPSISESIDTNKEREVDTSIEQDKEIEVEEESSEVEEEEDEEEDLEKKKISQVKERPKSTKKINAWTPKKPTTNESSDRLEFLTKNQNKVVPSVSGSNGGLNASEVLDEESSDSTIGSSASKEKRRKEKREKKQKKEKKSKDNSIQSTASSDVSLPNSTTNSISGYPTNEYDSQQDSREERRKSKIMLKDSTEDDKTPKTKKIAPTPPSGPKPQPSNGSMNGSNGSYLNIPRPKPVPVFGRHLHEVGNPLIPLVVSQSIEYLSSPFNLTEEGILRQSGSKSLIDRLKLEFDEGKDVSFNVSGVDAHTISGLLKSYFRELPEPIIPIEINDQMSSVIAQQNDPQITANISLDLLIDSIKMELHDLLHQIPEANFEVFKMLVIFLSKVMENSGKNKMGLTNILTCLTPSLRITPGIIKFCMEDNDFFFNPQM